MLHSPGQETFKHTGQMTNIEFVVEINGGLFKIVAHTIVQIQSGIDNVDTHALNLFRKTLLQMIAAGVVYATKDKNRSVSLFAL